MQILIHRFLPEKVVEDFKLRFPQYRVVFLRPEEPLGPYLGDTDILLANPNSAEILNQTCRLKWLQLMSSGIDGYESLSNASFHVTTAHGIHAPVIAQHLLLMLLTFERKQPFFNRRQSERHWDRQARLPGLLRNSTIGFLGFGSIAEELVRILKPFHLNLQAVTRNPESRKLNQRVKIASMDFLDILLETSDHLIVSLPSNQETRGILSEEKLSKIKSGAFLYNIGRGDLINESVLTSCLQNGQLGGAALDVFAQEPLPYESELWKLDNCIITPHIAGHYRNLDIDLLHFFARNLERFDRGKPLLNEARFQ